MSRSKADIEELNEPVSEVIESKVVDSEINEIGNKVSVVDKVMQPVLAASTFTTPKKIGVVRYLQLYPQNIYVEAAMKAQYKSKVCTVEEWDKLTAKVKKTLGVE